MDIIEQVERPEQIADLAELAKEIWEEYFTPLIGAGQVAYMLERFQSEEAIGRMIREEGYEYVWLSGKGYAGWKAEPEDRCLFLSKLYVAAAMRGTGLGKRLLARAEDRARALGLRKIRLTVNRGNAGSIAFYEHVGFEKTGTMAKDIGDGYVMDDFLMAKGL